MRKRNIKSIAHWVIMSVLLLFPVLMVGVSAFANDEQTTTVNTTYQYETNEVNSASDLVVGNVYKCNWTQNLTGLDDNIVYDYFYFRVVGGNFRLDLRSNPSVEVGLDEYMSILDGTDIYFSCHSDYNYLVIGSDSSIGSDDEYIQIYIDPYLNIAEDCIFYMQYLGGANVRFVNNQEGVFLSASDYLGEATTTVDIQESNYKQEVNDWANGFKNLPVNQWYGNLLDAIGVGATTNSVMNVIYVYPLYVLWVYILDLIVDCLLLIINFGHNALQRLGADNE